MDRFIRCCIGLLAVVPLTLNAGLPAYSSPWSFWGVRQVIKPVPGQPIPATFAFRNAANGSIRVVAGTIGRATLGAAVRAAALSPTGLAVVAGLTAAGYIIDQQSGSIQGVVPNTLDAQYPGRIGTFTGVTSSKCLYLSQRCSVGAAYAEMMVYIENVTAGRPYSISGPNVRVSGATTYLDYDISFDTWNFTQSVGIYTGLGDPVVPGPTQVGPVTDTQLADWALNNLPAAQLPDLLRDPATGQPQPVPEAEPARDQLNRDWRAANPVPPPDVQSPEHQATDPATNPGTQPAGWPAACSWMPTICATAQRLSDWLDWTREAPNTGEPEQLPTQTVGALQTYNAPVGAGSCPAPPTFTLQGSTFEVPTQQFCTAMGYLRPIVLTFAGLLSIMIIMGVRSNG